MLQEEDDQLVAVECVAEAAAGSAYDSRLTTYDFLSPAPFFALRAVSAGASRSAV
jgi:hypothetical protein